MHSDKCSPCSDVGIVNSVTVTRASAVPYFCTFYSHVLQPTSLFHLEEMFLPFMQEISQDPPNPTDVTKTDYEATQNGTTEDVSCLK